MQAGSIASWVFFLPRYYQLHIAVDTTIGSKLSFTKIKAVSTVHSVIGRLGSPSWDGVCFDPKHNIYGDATPGLKARCAREFGYRAAFGGLPDGSYYLVWFDADGTVVRTAEIRSP